jgi:hypothetical protein
LPTLSRAPRTSPTADKAAQSKVHRPNLDYVHIGLFCLFIYGFMAFAVVDWICNKSKLSQQEKRPYATFPHLRLSVKSIKEFPGGFESFFNDRFPLRVDLVALANQLKWKLLHASGSDKVLIGKNGWLFYLDNGNAEFLKHEAMPPERLAAFVNMFESRHWWLAKHHMKYLLVFVPCKCEIYRELVPNEYRTLSLNSMQDQLLAALKELSSVDVIDLRKDLLDEKQRLGSPLYLETDSHWNQLGAFVAYQPLINHLADIFPAIKPLKWQDVKVTSEYQCGGDLAGMLGLRHYTAEEVVLVKRKRQHWGFSQDPPPPDLNSASEFFHPFATEVNDPRLPRAYFIRDSYTINLQPFLSENFSRAFFHWNYFRRADDDFLPQEILKEHPDIVVQEMAENLLARDALPNPEELASTSPNPFSDSNNVE